MPSLLLCLIALLPAQLVDDSEPDTVFLLDGKTREGRVVYEDDLVLVLRDGSREREIPQDEIKEVDAVSRHLAELLERLAAGGPIPGRPANELLELARFADQARLPGEARLLYWATLLVEPTNEQALEALDARTRGGEPQIKNANQWRPVDELHETPEDWGDRWQFRTTHYELDSNQALPDVIAAAFEAERYYAAFYDVFARPLGLREPLEMMHLWLHADDASYPEPGDGRAGFYDPDDQVAELDVGPPDWPSRLAHEMTLQLIHQTSQRAPKARGQVPRWAQVGLAMSFSAGRSGPPGLGTYDLTALAPDAIRTHAAARDPYDLDRVLVFAAQDYAAQSDQDLKYAQSYTLVQTLLAARNGALRDDFLAFLRAAYEGRGSPTVFEDVLGIEEDELEEIWAEHLAELVARL